ncbi:MAG: RsmE family RNA methyltransferase [Armatimonadota bacterium]|nr:RsmE family RNA methyltransferase [Armatimonadota bacterium]MDR7451246.1 RsmE family RNA methyltransferase [Armatimonadota bacterium]MDR7466851.1 RsmE family RNA methyltransferase [Armatimonadota bacterium]MDR7492676.1 RsmE family RNA methyltransferase [Armatimonadota bacterium]MDR7499605.1 RsmE family RNA methyltransferase [Armatimonadota bacterium]
MRRFVAPADAVVGGRVTLAGREAHHLAVVLRLGPGDRVLVVDGSGREHIVRLTDVRPDEVLGEVLETRPGLTAPLDLVLVQGVPKGRKMDDIVRMGTELGVSAFIPALTLRSVAQGRDRAARWRRIAAEATKQCRRADLPEVADPVPLATALERVAGADLLLLLWEGESMRTLADVLRDAAPRRVALLVGPEGGFDQAEVRQAVRCGAVPVTLGPLTLRTETAGMVAAAMVLYELTLRRI